LDGTNPKDLHVTAFVGQAEFGKTVSFSIGEEYVKLSQKQALDLALVLTARVFGLRGYQATDPDWIKEKVVDP
jgi:hypothetical protein